MKEIIDRIGIKKMITIGAIFIGIVIVTIIGALIYNKFFYKKTYSEIESIMINAATNYYEENNSKLPSNSGDSININADTLINKEYMKSFNDYLKDKEASCTGNVNVTKVNKKYRYTPFLECDKDYKTETLLEIIKKKNKPVTSGDGLYELNNELVFRGENPNNNIEFVGYKWRIVKITDNKLVLILDETINEDEPRAWDDRYNNQKDEDSGINDYPISRIYEFLKSLYNSKQLFKNKDKLLITNYDLYIGKRKDEDKDKTGSLEKSKILENQYIGLLPAYDFMNASLDINCNQTNSLSCKNYNYLTNYLKNWWLVTGNASNTYKVYKNANHDSIFTVSANTEAYVRPVITLVSDAIYISGNGTTNKPYKFK